MPEAEVKPAQPKRRAPRKTTKGAAKPKAAPTVAPKEAPVEAPKGKKITRLPSGLVIVEN